MEILLQRKRFKLPQYFVAVAKYHLLADGILNQPILISSFAVDKVTAVNYS